MRKGFHNMMRQFFFSRGISVLLLLFSLYGISSCGGGGSGEVNLNEGVVGPTVSGTPDDFRGAGIINDSNFLIGGPLSQGREGDILLQNDHVRLIIQKPTRNTGVGLFGGNIIDADRFRPSSEAGQDQFGSIFPLLNLAWTVNYRRLEIINADFSGGPVVVRATGVLDVYDYIQTNIIVPFAKSIGASLFYADQFDDIFDPFENVPELRDFSLVVVTDYILKPDSSYVIIETQLKNEGEEAIQMPVGDWLNGSGTLEPFIPKKGFLNTPLVDGTPALIYQGMEDNVDVSYGYFYNPIDHIREDGTIPASASLTVSGVTPVVLGEGFLQIIPIGGPQDPKINFTLQPGVRTITRYFAIGSGDVATVLDAGFEALGVSRVRASGVVKDGNGNAVERARVVFLDSGSPVSVAFSDGSGSFSANISSGTDAKAQMFGSGSYTVEVYKEGYLLGNGPRAGKCAGGNFDSANSTITGIECSLGNFGTVAVSVGENGNPIPARVTIVGFDPSPIHEADPDKIEDFGKYHDLNLSKRPYGIVDLLYVGHDGALYPQGNPRVMGGNQLRLEPGEYEIFVTRGMEYSVYSQKITVAAGGAVNVSANLNRVVDTSGFVSADLHLHGIRSADSAWGLESRVRSALAEGMDVLVSTDHDFLTDYGPAIQAVGAESMITSMVGDEITALAFGHFTAFPLTVDPNSTTGGAYDYTFVDSDKQAGPQHDLGQTVEQILDGIDQDHPGTQVIQLAHILDEATGMFSITGLVTSTAFEGVAPLSTYGDPVRFRMPANTNSGGNFQAPYPLGSSGLFSTNYTSMELVVGAYDDTLSHLMETSLPTYFNMLNLGLLRSATASSDTHTEVHEPMGVPRNYILSSVDPRDGLGNSYQAIDHEEFAVNANSHGIIVSSGVFVRPRLISKTDAQEITVGGSIGGTGEVTLEIAVTSNEYFDWDTVEVYANTQTTPAKDDMSGVTDLSAEEFHQVSSSHRPRYLMTPLFSFHKGGSGDAALNQTLSGGARQAVLTKDFSFSEDTWIVIVVRGVNTPSTFPYLTKGANSSVDPANFLNTLQNNPKQIGGIQPWAFSNPMFVDVDGNGFEAIHIRDGKSPLAN